MRRRDKFHAHFDKEYFFDPLRLAEDAPLVWADLDNVMVVVGEIIIRYSTAYDGQIFSLKPENILDLDHLLNDLRKLSKLEQ